MKLFSRIVLGAAMLATGLTSLAGMSYAGGVTATTAAESYRFDAPGGVTDYEGLRFTLDGAYDSGIEWEAELRSGDAEGAAYKSFEGELAYLHNGMAGPKVAYSHASLDGAGSEETRIGITARHALSPDLSVYGDLMTDVDRFGDDGAILIGANYAITSDLSVWGELERDDLGAARADSAELGVSYAINERVGLDGRIHLADTDGTGGIDSRGISAGLVFPF